MKQLLANPFAPSPLQPRIGILPRRFVKIRRFGIYNHTTKRNLALQFVVEEKPDIDAIKKQQLPETNAERFARLTGGSFTILPNYVFLCNKAII